MFEARFQSFDDPQPAKTGPRVQALRAELSRRGLSGFVVPRADRHQNEYGTPSEERLAWLTGFTGSAGLCIVLGDRAALFVDGRYTLQAAAQVDPAIFSVVHLTETPPERWLEANLPADAKLGYDPWLHTSDGAERLARACGNAGASLEPVESNPIDAIWSDRPAPPLGPVALHDQSFAGETASAKLARIQTEIATLRADALVISDPHAVAWTFNIRGADLAHTPVALAFAIVPRQGRPTLYVEGAKLDNAVRHKLEEVTDVREPAAFTGDLAALGQAQRSVRLDQATAADALSRIVTAAGGKVTRGLDPIAMMKAVKNPVEIEGARQAQRRDGAAVTRFLAWFDREAPRGQLTEIGAAEALESFRRDTGKLKDVSFPTIAGAGPNGAIVHYRVTRSSNRTIASGRVVPDRLRRPIPGRHHRHYPHGGGRRSQHRNARALHARAEGPYRDRPRGVSRRHHRRAARSVRPGRRCGRPASISTTAPATASAAIYRCTRARRASPSSATLRSSTA